MSFYSRCRSLPQRFRLVLSSFMQRDDLPFADVLLEAMIEQAFADADADFAREDALGFLVTGARQGGIALVPDGGRACQRAVDVVGQAGLLGQHGRVLPGAGQAAGGDHWTVEHRRGRRL